MAQVAVLTCERFDRRHDHEDPVDITEIFPDHAAQLLNHLRLAALTCRVSARTEVAEACRAFSADPMVSKVRYAELLVRCLGHILSRPPQFYSPGVKAISEDETWLMRLILTLAVGNSVSAGFLLRSRVPSHMHSSLIVMAGAFGSIFELE